MPKRPRIPPFTGNKKKQKEQLEKPELKEWNDGEEQKDVGEVVEKSERPAKKGKYSIDKIQEKNKENVCARCNEIILEINDRVFLSKCTHWLCVFCAQKTADEKGEHKLGCHDCGRPWEKQDVAAVSEVNAQNILIFKCWGVPENPGLRLPYKRKAALFLRDERVVMRWNPKTYLAGFDESLRATNLFLQIPYRDIEDVLTKYVEKYRKRGTPVITLEKSVQAFTLARCDGEKNGTLGLAPKSPAVKWNILHFSIENGKYKIMCNLATGKLKSVNPLVPDFDILSRCSSVIATSTFASTHKNESESF